MRNEKTRFLIAVWMALTISFVIGGCDSLNALTGSVDEGSTTPRAKINVERSVVQVGTQVTLNGTLSSDPKAEQITYAWAIPEKPPGSSAALSSDSDPVVTFTPDGGGFYTVTLRVKNESGESSALTSARIDAVGTGDNHPPIANAGADLTVTLGGVAILDGTASYDQDQDQLSYQWSFINRPATSAITELSDSNSPIAFLYPDVAGVYDIRLRVGDYYDADDDFTVVTAQEVTAE